MERFKWICNVGYDNYVELCFSCAVVLVIRWIATTLWSKYRGLPPGPIGLPLVGYWPFFLFSPEKRFKELGEKYGPIYGVKLGTRYLVVLNDYETTTEAYRKDAATARPPFEYQNFSKFDNLGGMSGSEWKDHRKFFVGYLKTLYRNEPGKLNLQDILFEEVNALINLIDDKVGDREYLLNVHDLVKQSINNVMLRYLFSETVPLDHPFIKSMYEQQKPFLNQAIPFNVVACFPELRWLLRRIVPSQRVLKRASKEMSTFINQVIEKHRKTLDPENPRDYVDSFLIKQRENPADPSYCDEILSNNCQLLLLGGVDAMRTSIEWMLMLMAKHSDIQEKICKEIHEVFGKEQKPRWEDRYLVPFTMATILECQRWKTIQPMSSTRMASEDFTVKGYLIPKGSHMVSNLIGINYDEKYWKDPAVFKPERYLDGNGKTNVNQRLAAFSYGKRDCPGSQQALMELFYALVAILQKYHLKAPPGGISLEEDDGMIRGPASPVIRFVLRN